MLAREESKPVATTTTTTTTRKLMFMTIARTDPEDSLTKPRTTPVCFQLRFCSKYNSEPQLRASLATVNLGDEFFFFSLFSLIL